MTEACWILAAHVHALETVKTEQAFMNEFGCIYVNRSHSGGRPTFKFRDRKATIAQAIAMPTRGQHTRHLCGDAACVNPNHLIVGTPSENAFDAYEQGALERGARHPKAVDLSSEDAAVIRRDKRPQREIARKWGIAQSTVGQIKRRERRWAEE
ncbi:hypothetical protein [Tateyamaria sp. Alg231-49]|uniref:hypothetical protein n=1 Tax=Tateyamaria sp. Alg231-49 TaxID=1922219 RepID=UPI000D55ADDC